MNQIRRLPGERTEKGGTATARTCGGFLEKCPACGLEVSPANGIRCPRCNTLVAVGCAGCMGCSLGSLVGSRADRK